MKLAALLAPLALAACAAPHASLSTNVDGPLRVDQLAGESLWVTNLGPGELRYVYATDSGTRCDARMGPYVRVEIPLEGVHEVELEACDGARTSVRLWVSGGSQVSVRVGPDPASTGASIVH